MTRLRLVLAISLVALIAMTAGCSTIFGGISDETLDQNETYDDLRDRDADVVISIDGSDGLLESNSFRAVYDLNDTDELSLYRSTFYREEALDIEAVRYWYPNGTEVTGSNLSVDQGRSSTTIRVPDGNGSVAFRGEADSKTFQLPAFVSGSYEVLLPEGHRTDNFFFGNVNPNGYERETIDGREHLYWEENDRAISIRFFLSRDIPLFAGLVGVATLIGGTGIAYYYRRVKQLQKRREEMGLDVELEDDSDGGPPGMP